MRHFTERAAAFLIDVCLAGIVTLPFLWPITDAMQNDRLSKPLFWLLYLLILAAFAALLILRDVLLKGRSVGKRLFGLHVRDKHTLADTRPVQLIQNNLFFWIPAVDLILLLATGATLGNRVSDTVVTAEEKPLGRRRFWQEPIVWLALFAVAGIAVIGTRVLPHLFHSARDTEEYQAAYAYLKSSEAFQMLGEEESAIHMQSYQRKGALKNGSTATITFCVAGQNFTVVCHAAEDAPWAVCTECTAFD